MPPCPEVVSHWWTWYPPVGVFIALVAVIAFIFPIIYDAEHKVTLKTKLAWTVIVAILVFLEIRSTHYDRKQNLEVQDNASCQQLHDFEGIASKLESDIKQNQEHFDATMEEEKGILATAKAVGKLSQKNLENITGGESFAYAVPFTTRTEFSNYILVNDGDQVLSGVNVVIERYVNNCSLEASSLCIPQFQHITPSIEMGTLGPHQHKPFPQPTSFVDKEAGTGHYNIRVYAQNGQSIEEIWFRRSTSHQGYAYRFNVFRQIRGTAHKGDFKIGETTFRTLKTVDWTEYSPEESLDGIHLYVRH